MTLKALRIDLGEFARRNNFGPDAQMKGLASAAVHLSGEGTDISGLKGDGRIDVPDGKLYKLPLQLDLLKAFGLRLPDRTAFEQAHAVFAIDGPQLQVQSLDLYGNAVSLRGKGTVDLVSGDNLNLDFNADWGRLAEVLPAGVNDIPRAVSDQLLKIKMRGRIGDVHFEKELAPRRGRLGRGGGGAVSRGQRSESGREPGSGSSIGNGLSVTLPARPTQDRRPLLPIKSLDTEADVFGSILHRMILWELIKVFVMSLVGITGILLMAGIVAEASQQGLGPAQILAAIPLLIPSTLPYTIPATTLFACCVVYGRLAADNEILAIKSSGVNILQVVRPGLLLGLAISGVTLGPVLQRHPLVAPDAAPDGLQRRGGAALFHAPQAAQHQLSSNALRHLGEGRGGQQAPRPGHQGARPAGQDQLRGLGPGGGVARGHDAAQAEHPHAQRLRHFGGRRLDADFENREVPVTCRPTSARRACCAPAT